jgi:hypothetical protein
MTRELADAAADSAAAARLAGFGGLVGVFGNVVAVALLHEMPSAYRLARLEEWVNAVHAQPIGSVSSSVAFTLGLIALAGWAMHLGRAVGAAAARAGAALIAACAMANAVGTLSPIVQALHVGSCGPACDAVGRALLGFSLALDALFNLALGIGLLLAATGVREQRRTRTLMQAAGLLSLPVAAQAVWDPAATMLYFAAPLWLAVIVTTSLSWLKGHVATPR